MYHRFSLPRFSGENCFIIPILLASLSPLSTASIEVIIMEKYLFLNVQTSLYRLELAPGCLGSDLLDFF
jgi:hypothetical protein